MNPSPVSDRKNVRFLLALTILAWATQTLLHQWAARGQDAPAADGAAAAERFVPATPVGATVEMQVEAATPGAEIKLRQICRWTNREAGFMAPVADLTIARFEGKVAFVSVSLDEVRHTLADAGLNLGLVKFAGSTVCTVSRTDVKYDEAAALQQWIDAREGKVPARTPLEIPAPAVALPMPTPATVPAMTTLATPAAEQATVRSLRDLILDDASVRLGVPLEQMQVNFNPADEKFLNLCEPQFKFYLTPRNVYGLGEVTWEVLIVTDAGNKKLPITATARQWQRQIVLTRPLAFNSVIQGDDVMERRVLSDHAPDAPLLSMAQVVGQQASRELKPGTILIAPMINPIELAQTGQTITVILVSGGVRIRTAGRAMDSGTFGQTIRVKNETSGEMYQVVLTGRQEGTISPPARLAVGQ